MQCIMHGFLYSGKWTILIQIFFYSESKWDALQITEAENTVLKNNQKMSHLNFQAIDNFRISILKKNYAMIFLRVFLKNLETVVKQCYQTGQFW